MNTKKWVQHRSGDGEKWQVVSEHLNGWKVLIPALLALGSETWFPKSEYVECSPPETWHDATDEFKVSEGGGNLICRLDGSRLSSKGYGYRLRKVPVNFTGPNRQCGCEKGEAFIVEKRQP